MTTTASVACVLLLTCGVAAADDEPEVPSFDWVTHVQLEPGVRVGSYVLDGTSEGAVGAEVALGVRVNRYLLSVELSDLGISPDTTSSGDSAPKLGAGGTSTAGGSGSVARLGVAGRVYLARWPTISGTPLLADVWIAAGAGRERLTWDLGGTLGRNDLMASVGVTFGGHAYGWRAGQRRWWGGMTLAVEIYVAHRDDGTQPAACGGPCDAPSSPSRYDRSVMVDFTIPFGK